jgi:hypothetical protein
MRFKNSSTQSHSAVPEILGWFVLFDEEVGTQGSIAFPEAISAIAEF